MRQKAIKSGNPSLFWGEHFEIRENILGDMNLLEPRSFPHGLCDSFCVIRSKHFTSFCSFTGKPEQRSLGLLGNSIQSNYSSRAWHSDSHVLMMAPQWNIDLSDIRIGAAWQFNTAKFNPFPSLQASLHWCVACGKLQVWRQSRLQEQKGTWAFEHMNHLTGQQCPVLFSLLHAAGRFSRNVLNVTSPLLLSPSLHRIPYGNRHVYGTIYIICT